MVKQQTEPKKAPETNLPKPSSPTKKDAKKAVSLRTNITFKFNHGRSKFIPPSIVKSSLLMVKLANPKKTSRLRVCAEKRSDKIVLVIRKKDLIKP